MTHRVWTLAIAFALLAPQRGGGIAPFSLVFAEPADGRVFTDTPTRIRLVFSERIDPSAATIVLIASDGSALKLAPAIDPHLLGAVIAAVPPLKPGQYRAQWQIASAGGIPLSGTYSFTFGPNAVVPAPDDSSHVVESGDLLSRAVSTQNVMRGFALALAVVFVVLVLVRRRSTKAS